MAEKLKDTLFPLKKIQLFARIINDVYPQFKSDTFIAAVCDNDWHKRELKEKMRHTTVCLHQFLPANFSKAVNILVAIVPKVTGFEAIVLPDYIEVYGLNHWNISLPALGELTKCGSSEYGIRPFLNQNLIAAMKYMSEWADNEDVNIRRFACEGCRPRLPWAAGVPALKKDPSLILPILEKLKNDPEIYVRKSVANNLNDISKDHPALVLDICQRWQGHSKNTDWIIKHACRTLLKQGNKRAMLLFGFANPQLMSINQLHLSNKALRIGNVITFSFELKLNIPQKQKIRIEYIVNYIKANGKPSPKVFQIKESEMKAGTHSIAKKHAFKNLSTRKHYPGNHKIEIIVNGEAKAAATFILKS